MAILTDALTSVLTIVALITGPTLDWIWRNPALGVVGTVVIARWPGNLMRDFALVLLDTTDPALVERVRDHVKGQGTPASPTCTWGAQDRMFMRSSWAFRGQSMRKGFIAGSSRCRHWPTSLLRYVDPENLGAALACAALER